MPEISTYIRSLLFIPPYCGFHGKNILQPLQLPSPFSAPLYNYNPPISFSNHLFPTSLFFWMSFCWVFILAHSSEMVLKSRDAKSNDQDSIPYPSGLTFLDFSHHNSSSFPPTTDPSSSVSFARASSCPESLNRPQSSDLEPNPLMPCPMSSCSSLCSFA